MYVRLASVSQRSFCLCLSTGIKGLHYYVLLLSSFLKGYFVRKRFFANPVVKSDLRVDRLIVSDMTFIEGHEIVTIVLGIFPRRQPSLRGRFTRLP